MCLFQTAPSASCSKLYFQKSRLASGDVLGEAFWTKLVLDIAVDLHRQLIHKGPFLAILPLTLLQNALLLAYVL